MEDFMTDILETEGKVESKFKNKLILYDGIRFRSNLEKRAYQLFINAGFSPKYEPTIYTIIDKYLLLGNVQFFRPFKKVLNNNRKTLQAVTYTPDFVFNYNNYLIIVDTKGKKNETYPIKIKLFLQFLDKNANSPILFFEPHSIRQINQAIGIIKSLPNPK